jgi:hypothetical protein
VNTLDDVVIHLPPFPTNSAVRGTRDEVAKVQDTDMLHLESIPMEDGQDTMQQSVVRIERDSEFALRLMGAD